MQCNFSSNLRNKHVVQGQDISHTSQFNIQDQSFMKMVKLKKKNRQIRSKQDD